MKTLLITLRLVPAILFCLCLAGCGETTSTAVVEQPQKTAEELKAESDAYDKEMNN